MAPGFAFSAGILPQLLAVAGMLILGIVLLVLHFESRLNRVFSLFLILRGLSMLTAAEWQVLRLSDPVSSAEWLGLFPYFTIATPLVLAYFVWVYPRPRLDLDREWLPAALVTGSIVVLEAAYLVNPSLWSEDAVVAAGYLTTVDQGPLIAMLGLVFLMFAVAGLVFAIDSVRSPEGPQRRSLLLVSLAFTVNALFDGTGSALFVFGVTSFTDVGLPGYMGAASLLPAIAAPVALFGQAIRTGDAHLRRQATTYGAIVLLGLCQ